MGLPPASFETARKTLFFVILTFFFALHSASTRLGRPEVVQRLAVLALELGLVVALARRQGGRESRLLALLHSARLRLELHTWPLVERDDLDAPVVWRCRVEEPVDDVEPREVGARLGRSRQARLASALAGLELIRAGAHPEAERPHVHAGGRELVDPAVARARDQEVARCRAPGRSRMGSWKDRPGGRSRSSHRDIRRR